MTVQGGFAFRGADFVDDGVPIVRMSDLDNGKIDLDGAARITEQKLKYLSNFALNDGDFLVGMSGSIGNYAIVRKKDLPAYLNQRVGRFRLANGELADYDFVTQVARSDSYKLHVELLAAGAAQLNISPRQIESFRFDVPPKPEQTKIAEILSTVDQAVEQTEALIAKQQRIKTGLMQDLLTRGIDEHGNLRSEQTHQFKNSPLGRIPVEWEIDKFGSRIESSAFGPRFPASAYSENGNIAMLRTTDLDNDGNIAYSNMPLATLDLKTFRPHFLHKGDLLISRSGTVGIPSVFEGFDVPVIPGAFLIRFRFHRDLTNSAYWKYYFNWEQGRHRLVSLSEGGVQKNLRGSAINQMIMAFPTISEQNQVASIFIRFDEDIRVQEQALIKLHSLKTALMQDLLTGKKRVTPLLTETQEAGA